VVSTTSSEPAEVGIGEVGTIVRTGALVAVSTELDPAAATVTIAPSPGLPATLQVELAGPTVACGYGPGGNPEAPLVILVVDGTARVVAGTPWTG
jgi:hypothetical protein